MKIESLYINGFGLFNNVDIKDLSPGLNLFYGTNESGKSSLHAFLRTILFGFPDGRTKENIYPPLYGGNHGGNISLTQDDGSKITIERYTGPRGGRAEIFNADGSRSGKESLSRILPVSDPSLFNNIYAFSLTELQNFETLNSDAVNDALFSAGAGVNPESLKDLKTLLQKKEDELFKPKGKKGKINRILHRLKEISREKKKLSFSPDEYDRLIREIKSLEGEITAEEKEKVNLTVRLKKLEQYSSLYPLLVDLDILKQKLEKTEPVHTFPVDGVSRYKSLKARLIELSGEYHEKKRRLAEAGKGKKELPTIHVKDEQDIRMYKASLRRLKSLYNEYQLLEKELMFINERISELHSGKQEHEEKSGTRRFIMPLWPAVITFAAAIPLIWLIYSGGFNPVNTAGALFFILSGVVMLAARRHRLVSHEKRAEENNEALLKLEKKITEQEEKKEGVDERLSGINSDISVHKKKLFIETEITAEALETKEDEVLLQETIFYKKKEYDKILSRISSVKAEIKSLFNKAGAADEEAFLLRGKIYEERELLLKEIETLNSSIRRLIGASENADQLVKEISRLDMNRLAGEKASIEESLKNKELILNARKREQAGLEEKARAMVKDDQLSRLRAEEKDLKEELEARSIEWITTRFAKGLYSRAIAGFEKERQPGIISEAERLLSSMTLGRYPGIAAPLGENRIELIDKNMNRKSINQLSRGTAEQLYLALRFGFIIEFTKHAGSMPVIMDEILVNFDRERSIEAIRGILELSKSQQILYFTCHPNIVELFTQLDSEISVKELSDGRITDIP